MKKRLRLPNGYGSITLRNDSRRRRPGIVRVPVNGKQVTIGYVDKYEDGLTMLADYHKDPLRFVTNKASLRFNLNWYYCGAKRYYLNCR